jgi:hypothetical protein
MKKMFAGIFLAASAAPMALIVGFFAFRHLLGGFPNAVQVAATTAGCVLALGLFVFMAGLVTKVDIPRKAIEGEWSK